MRSGVVEGVRAHRVEDRSTRICHVSFTIYRAPTSFYACIIATIHGVGAYVRSQVEYRMIMLINQFVNFWIVCTESPAFNRQQDI